MDALGRADAALEPCGTWLLFVPYLDARQGGAGRPLSHLYERHAFRRFYHADGLFVPPSTVHSSGAMEQSRPAGFGAVSPVSRRHDI